ncbi:MAG TPA: DUF11 domain-containing protein [Acidimicrobiales bacterium]|nr:DUF11 domain-containing protein [Acidimicrobiales bacterium]
MLLLGGLVMAGAASPSPASALPAVLYAYAAGRGATSGCPQSSTANAQCSLSEALSQVQAGGTIDLETSGVEGTTSTYYVGGFALHAGTATNPVIIQPGPGMTTPILDGDDQGAAGACDTCTGQILTVRSKVGLDVIGVTFQNGFGGGGGAISMESGAAVQVSGSTFTDDVGDPAGAIGNDGGTLSVSNSTFSSDSSGSYGGAIDNEGTATVADSTFSDDGGEYQVMFPGGGGESGGSDEGGAIANGLDGGTGTLTVIDSTFTANVSGIGGAIASGVNRGTGTLTVVASTFSANDGGAIASGVNNGTGTVVVAGDVFAGSACTQGTGTTWTDDGYNVATDTSCFSATPAAGDVNAGATLVSELGALSANGGPTETMMPLTGNPAIGDIPLTSPPLQVTLPGGTAFTLCPVVADQRGDASQPGHKCDSGSVQGDYLTSTPSPTTVTLADGTEVLNDSAVLANLGADPTAKIIFTLDRGSTQVDSESVTATGDGTYGTSGYTLPTDTTVTGTYQWTATYQGDSNNASASDASSDEQVVVNAARPGLNTTPGGTVVVGAGDALIDSATLSSGYAPRGTITFALDSPGGATVYSDVVIVSGDGTYTTATGSNPGGYQPTVPGTYQWLASYSGDGNNTATGSRLGDEPEAAVNLADLRVTKSAPAAAQPQSVVTYRITVANQGPDPAASVTLSDPLVGTTFVSESHPAGWACTAPPVGAAGTFTCTIAQLAPSDGVQHFALSVRVGVSPGVVTNTASVATLTMDSHPADEAASASTNVACDHTQGSSAGALTIGSGSTCIVGATIGGTLLVPAGATLVLLNSTVTGGLLATSGPGSVVVCGSSIGGTVQVTGATGFVLLGDPGDDGCAGNTLHSSLLLASNHGAVQVADNHIAGSVSVTGTSGTGPFPGDVGAQIEANTIGGSLICSGNKPRATDDGQPNFVAGPSSSCAGIS